MIRLSIPASVHEFRTWLRDFRTMRAKMAWERHCRNGRDGCGSVRCARCDDYNTNASEHVPPTPCDIGKELIERIYPEKDGGREERRAAYERREAPGYDRRVPYVRPLPQGATRKPETSS